MCKPRALLDEEHTSCNEPTCELRFYTTTDIARCIEIGPGDSRQQKRQTQRPTSPTRVLVYRTAADRRNTCANSVSQFMKWMSVKRQCTLRSDRSQTDINVLDEKAKHIVTTGGRRSPHSLILIDQDHEHALPKMRFSRSNVRRASGASPQK